MRGRRRSSAAAENRHQRARRRGHRHADPACKGKGNSGTKGDAAPGDLLITFQVRPDRFYRREGLDLVAPVPISIADATLGKKINVKTLDGTKVSIRIPAGTQSGKRFRVRGQGIEKDGARGDLLVHVELKVPEKLTPEQEEAMRKFADAMKT